MRSLPLAAAAAALLAWVPARADFCMLTQNALHLGQGDTAYKEAKRAELRRIFQDYDVVVVQEVMTADEPALVAPAGFTATVSEPRGASTYRERYAVLTRDAAVTVLGAADYPDSEGRFARRPFGVAVRDAAGAYWVVDFHAVYGRGGAEPRRREVAAMAEVMAWFAARDLPGGTVPRVVVAGDWNLPATDQAFVEFETAVPGTFAAPNVKSSLNARGDYASPYDHFVWNRAVVNVEVAAEPRDTGGLATPVYRDTVSDHVGVAGWISADPHQGKPDHVACPPGR